MGYKAKPVPSLDAKRSSARMDAAELALLTREYVPEAIGTLVQLMRAADRDSVRLRASVKLIELSAPDLEGEEEAGAKVYYIRVEGKADGQAAAPPQALGDELRKRLGKGPSARRGGEGAA